MTVSLVVCWEGITEKLVFSSAEFIADKVHSSASPDSVVVGVQSSGTGKGTDIEDDAMLGNKKDVRKSLFFSCTIVGHYNMR